MGLRARADPRKLHREQITRPGRLGVTRSELVRYPDLAC